MIPNEAQRYRHERALSHVFTRGTEWEREALARLLADALHLKPGRKKGPLKGIRGPGGQETFTAAGTSLKTRGACLTHGAIALAHLSQIEDHTTDEARLWQVKATESFYLVRLLDRDRYWCTLRILHERAKHQYRKLGFGELRDYRPEHAQQELTIKRYYRRKTKWVTK